MIVSPKPAILVTVLLLFCGKMYGNIAQKIMSSARGIYSVAYVTVPNQNVAKKIARGLVENKLAACVNIIPQITSVYEWKKEITEDDELLLMIKTRTETVESLTKYVKDNHPYEVCEVISFPIHQGNPQYLKWIGETVPSRSAATKTIFISISLLVFLLCSVLIYSRFSVSEILQNGRDKDKDL